VIELTYLAPVAPWFTLQPDIQYVIDPQNARASNALVAGLRATITF
jgi:carbohydrate-selective porin OprB